MLDSREPVCLEDGVRLTGVPVDRTVELPFADACFLGNGPDGETEVGFERKKLRDLVNSMKDRRLSGHQLRGMWSAYTFVYLVAEGVWREGSGGEIEEWGWDPRAKKQGWAPVYSDGQVGDRRAVSYEQLDHYLSTLELKGGVIVKRTKDERETARFYASRWKWFNGKAWHQHVSHDQVYLGLPAKAHGTGWGRAHGHDQEYTAPGRGRAAITQANPTSCWRAAACLPGIDRRAEKVAERFRTIRGMALAGLDPELRRLVEEWFEQHPEAAEREWGEIEGIGAVTAKAAIRAIAVGEA